jgi:Na+-driven multidrug efflux pump
MWILRLFPAYVLAFTFGFGVIGIESAIGFDVTLRGFACIWRLKSGKWKPKKAESISY